MPDGKKIIAVNPALAPAVRHLFEWYARGDICLHEMTKRAHAEGLLYARNGENA